MASALENQPFVFARSQASQSNAVDSAPHFDQTGRASENHQNKAWSVMLDIELMQGNVHALPLAQLRDS